MSALFPLIWFIVLMLFIIKKRGFGVCAYVILMYVITSFFALLMDARGLGYPTSNNSVISSLVYCSLISISIIPVYRLNIRGRLTIKIDNPQFVKFLIYFYFFCFFFLLIVYWRDIMFRVLLSDWSDIKVSAAAGNAYSIRQVGGILRPVSIVVRVFSSISFIMIPIFFLTMNPLKLHYSYSVMSIIGSMSSFVVAILDADRSRIIIWVLLLGLCLVIFWENLNKRVKRRVVPIIGSILFVAFFYLFIVSVSRFSDIEGGTESSVIQYAGQPYSNFCYFFDNFYNKEGGIHARVLFPFTHTFLFGDYVGGVDFQQEMTWKSGMYCGVFYTFLGLFILDSNKIGPFLFIVFYLFVWSLVLRRKGTEISITRFFMYFFLLLIPTYGCIAYMYSHWYLTFSVVVTLLLSRLTERKGA